MSHPRRRATSTQARRTNDKKPLLRKCNCIRAHMAATYRSFDNGSFMAWLPSRFVPLWAQHHFGGLFQQDQPASAIGRREVKTLSALQVRLFGFESSCPFEMIEL